MNKPTTRTEDVKAVTATPPNTVYLLPDDVVSLGTAVDTIAFCHENHAVCFELVDENDIDSAPHLPEPLETSYCKAVNLLVNAGLSSLITCI